MGHAERRARHRQIADYYAQGFSMRETATHFGLSIEGVRYALLARKAPIRQRAVGMGMSPKDRLAISRGA